MIQIMGINILDLSNYNFTIYTYLPLSVAFLSILLGIVVLLHENFSKASVIFCIMLFINAPIWFVGHAMMISAINPEVANVWFKIQAIGYVPIPTMLLLFLLTIKNDFRKFKYVLFSFAVINVLALYFLLFTNIIIVGTLKYFWGYYPEYDKFGMMHILIFSSMVSYNTFFLMQGYKKADSALEKRRMKLFVIALLIASIATVDFIASFNISFYPFGYLPIFIFLALMAKGILQYNLIDITPEMASYEILKTMHEILIITDLNGVIQVINPAAETFLRLTERNIIGKNLSAFFDELIFTDKPEKNIEEHLINIKDREIIYRSKDNEDIPINISASLIKDSSVMPVGIIFTGKDKRGYKKAQEEIKNAYGVTQMILEKIPIGIIILTLDKKIRIINQIALNMMGLKSEEEATVDPPDNLQAFIEQEEDRSVLDGELNNVTYETTVTSKAGTKIHVLKSVINMELNDVKVFLEAFVDISKRKELEEELVKHKDYLESEVKERTKKLQMTNEMLLSEVNIGKEIDKNLKEKLKALEEFKEGTVAREHEMIEIKRVINDLSKQLNRPPPFNLSFLR